MTLTLSTSDQYHVIQMRWYIENRSIGFKNAIQGAITQLSMVSHSGFMDGFKEPVPLVFGQKNT